MQYSNQEVVQMLRRAGFQEAAEEARDQLPDPIEEEELSRWCTSHRISQDLLVGRMGGSP